MTNSLTSNSLNSFERKLSDLLYSRLDLVNEDIQKCSDKEDLFHLHNHRDYLVNLVLVHEGKVEERDVSGATYTVIVS